MENIILKGEWIKAIAILPEPSCFLLGLLDYKLDRRKMPFQFPTEMASLTAIQPDFDKLNFPPDNGINTIKTIGK